MQPSKTWLVVTMCALVLSGCHYRNQERPYRPDPRDGHIAELLKITGTSEVEMGSVVISTQAVLARQPFQPEELIQVQIPRAHVSSDDLTDCWCAEGRLSRNNLPANHIVRQIDLLAQGIDEGWRPIYRAKKAVSADELFTEENTTCRFVRISAQDATQDILMHRATRPIGVGAIIHMSDIGPDLWEYVYYAQRPIRKGQVIDRTSIQMRLVKASDLDAEWNHADCSDTTEVSHAAKDIKSGAPIRCCDIK